MRRGRTGWTVVFPQFGLNAHCFEAKIHRLSLKVFPYQFKALSLLRIRFSFSPLGNRDDIFPQTPSVSTMSTKGNGQNRFGDFRFPRAGGLMHVSLLYAVSDGPSRALVVRLHAVIPPAGVQPPRHTRGARHGTHSPADGSFNQAFAVRDAAFASVSPPFTEIFICPVRGWFTRPRAAWRTTISEPVTPRAGPVCTPRAGGGCPAGTVAALLSSCASAETPVN